MANEIQIPLDPNPLGPLEPIFFTGTITPLSQVYADFVRSKLFGKHVREALARGILIASIDANEAKDIARIANAKSDETSERQDELEERWETVLAETTDGAEVIDARTGLRGTSWPTIKGRLDSMQAIDDKLNPISEVFSIEHNQNCYPVVRVLAFENGLGIGPLGVNLGGSNTITVNCDTEYMGKNSLKVKIPLAFAMTHPTTERISANEYLLVEGIKSLIIEVGTKAEANVETFLMKVIQSDFTDKVAGSIIENSNKMKAWNSVTLQTPSSNSWLEMSQNNYDLIKKLDENIYTGSTTINGQIRQMLISYDALSLIEKSFPGIFKNATTNAEKVKIVRDSIICWKIPVFCKGSGPAGNKVSLQTYFEGAGWSTIASHNKSEITELSYQNGSTTNGFIDSSGVINTIVYTDSSNGTIPSTVSIDYTNITITARVPFSKI